MRLSLLVNAAGRAGHLDRCILSFRRQTCLDFEMVIAEDGEEDATAAVIECHRADAPFPIRHVAQPREGHRRALILNKGIAACRADYILFTDCDVLAPAGLVRTHVEFRRARRMLVGGRVKLRRRPTEALTPEAVTSGAFESLLTPAHRRHLAWIHLKNQIHIATGKRRRPHNMGLNMSLAKSDLERVNGYDNEFHGWGNADGDLRERLRMGGVTCLSISSRAWVFHQWHPSLERGPGNHAYASRRGVPAIAENGLREAMEDFAPADASWRSNHFTAA